MTVQLRVRPGWTESGLQGGGTPFKISTLRIQRICLGAGSVGILFATGFSLRAPPGFRITCWKSNNYHMKNILFRTLLGASTLAFASSANAAVTYVDFSTNAAGKAHANGWQIHLVISGRMRPRLQRVINLVDYLATRTTGATLELNQAVRLSTGFLRSHTVSSLEPGGNGAFAFQNVTDDGAFISNCIRDRRNPFTDGPRQFDGLHFHVLRSFWSVLIREPPFSLSVLPPHRF